jgi:hypothetical protein
MLLLRTLIADTIKVYCCFRDTLPQWKTAL